MAHVKLRIGSVAVSAISAAGFASSMIAAPPVPQVGPEVLVPLDPLYSTLYHRTEPVIGVTPHAFGTPSQVHPHEIVIACNTIAPGIAPTTVRIEYNVSVDEGLTFHTQSAIWTAAPCGNQITFDPMVAVSPSTGDLYIGGGLVGVGSQLSLFVQRRMYGFIPPPGGDWFDPAIAVLTCMNKLDKPFMAMGPQPAGAAVAVDAMYVSHTHNSITTSDLESVKSADTTYPVGISWGSAYGVTSETGQTQRAGFGAFPVVVQSGLRQGRLIVASARTNRTSVTEVTYSDFGGDPSATPVGQQTWADYMQLDSYQVGPTLFPVYPTGSPPPLPGATNPPCFASVSLDPVHPERVYVVYPGLTSSTGTNIDLFIARSLDFGQSFVPTNTIRVTDAMLRLPSDCPGGACPSETDEWLPSIVVDDLGGINVMFLRTQYPDSLVEPIDVIGSEVRYARWSSDAHLAAGATPFISSFGFSRFWSGGNGAGHDYHMIKASGCYVYAAYSRGTLLSTAAWRTYFRRILVGPCRADMNRNGIISGEDLDIFVDEFIGATDAADMDGDDEVTSGDLDTFADAYCEGCTVPQ